MGAYVLKFNNPIRFINFPDGHIGWVSFFQVAMVFFRTFKFSIAWPFIQIIQPMYFYVFSKSYKLPLYIIRKPLSYSFVFYSYFPFGIYSHALPSFVIQQKKNQPLFPKKYA